ncbi:hypothetical protein F5Y14DRAFT_464073 [Nemania sp. NC0429]|nr:hypothetical protein F5Y14DRAFT_464073 [Nemania sp. NC0429]
MEADVECVAEIGSAAVADIKAFVEKRLREELLYHFICNRDELQRPTRRDDPKTIRLLRAQHLRNLEKTWDGVIQVLRTELPKALDEIFTNSKPDFKDPGDPIDVSIPSQSLFPKSIEVSGAPMAVDPPTLTSRITAMNSRKDANPEIVIDESDTTSELSDLSDNAFTKRAPGPDPEMPLTSPPKKKAKTTSRPPVNTPGLKVPNRKTTDLSQVNEEECIFSRPPFDGLYILRCNYPSCRKHLGRDGPTIFTSHPFRDGLAVDHFDGEVHQLESEAEIFKRFSRRVTDAVNECNLDKQDSYDLGIDNGGGGGGSGSGSGSGNSLALALGPANHQKSSDKSKEPKRPYNLHMPSGASAEHSTLTSTLRAGETITALVR